MKKITTLLCFLIFLMCSSAVYASEAGSESEEIIKGSVQNFEVDDPQDGRAQGYLGEGFSDSQTYTAKASYTHNSKFDGYTIKEVIDVAKYQGDIDWTEVKQSGIDYAIIRAGFRGYGTTGSLNTDPYFETNIKGALDAGLEVGVYFFSQAITVQEAEEEAEYTLNLIQGYDVSLPVVIDYEYASGTNGWTGRLYTAGLSKSAATKICKAFCSTVLGQGYTPMVYANKAMLEDNLNASEIAKDYKIWLANYVTSTSYAGEYEFWQYTQEGSVAGIYGNVDKNFWYIAPDAGLEIKDISVNIKDTLANRISGEWRYDTSFKIAEKLKEEMGIKKFDNIIVASGKNFADALSGSYLAYVKKAPMIITNGKNAHDVKTYIKENLKTGGSVYILGGNDAVPEGVGCGLQGFKVKRLQGATRYETNIEIMKESGVTGGEILICTGKNYADSLSGSAAKRPILLVNKELSKQQQQYLSSLSKSEFYIIGGTDAVSKAVENEIKKLGSMKRLSGETRLETSVLIAETFFDSPTSMILAVSNNFPDGLCGGPLAASMDSPLVLTRTGKEAEAKKYAQSKGIHKGIVLGGGSLVSDATAANVFGRLSELQNEASAEYIETEENKFAIKYDVLIGEKTSSDNNYYLMMADSYDGTLIGSPIAVAKKESEMSIATGSLSRECLREVLMSELALAVKTSDGSYQAVNQSVSISNPEVISKNTKKIFKASSKKGIQGITVADNGSGVTDARYANTKQTLINLDLAEVVGTGPEDGYRKYNYKGKSYYFSNCSALISSIQTLNSGYEQYLYGNNGNTKVAVSLCILLSYDDDVKYLIDPAARVKGRNYYMLNVQERAARETLEAVFLYLGEVFGQHDCYVTNWILGNEINSSKAWNYSGSLSFDDYMQRYVTAYKILYNAVKVQKTGNTVSISLDNGWTAVPDTYSGKKTLDAFAKKINEEDPNIRWSIAYHPYSYPLTRSDFWNDKTNTSDSVSTKYISMRNIKVLTDYAGTLEKKYNMPNGSIRVLLTEQGYSYSSNNPKLQALALARGYYTAEFNDRIDSLIIRAIVDDVEETKGGLYLGLMNTKTEKRIVFYVYEYMDSNLTKFAATSAESAVSAENYGKFNSAKEILCNTDWKTVIPGFRAEKLAEIK